MHGRSSAPTTTRMTFPGPYTGEREPDTESGTGGRLPTLRSIAWHFSMSLEGWRSLPCAWRTLVRRWRATSFIPGGSTVAFFAQRSWPVTLAMTVLCSTVCAKVWDVGQLNRPDRGPAASAHVVACARSSTRVFTARVKHRPQRPSARPSARAGAPRLWTLCN